MHKTTFPAGKQIERKWWLVDASGQTLGRLATKLAMVLRGKHKPSWSPHTDVGDYVVVINAKEVAVTGRKEKQKVYYRHSGKPGNLKVTTLATMRNTYPDRIIRLAVGGMLPKNPLGRSMLDKLHVYADAEHQQQAQVPQPLDLSGSAN